MTLGTLYDQMLEAGFEFKFIITGGLSVGSPLMGSDRETTRKICALMKEMKARWTEFIGYAELRLMSEGHEKPDWEPPTK